MQIFIIHQKTHFDKVSAKSERVEWEPFAVLTWNDPQAIVLVNFCVCKISKFLSVWFCAMQIVISIGHVVIDKFRVTHRNTQQLTITANNGTQCNLQTVLIILGSN